MRLDDEYTLHFGVHSIHSERQQNASSIEEAIVVTTSSGAIQTAIYKAMETPEKVNKTVAGTYLDTQLDGLQDEIEGAVDKNLKAPSSATSYGFLLVALLFYLVSIFTCAFLSVAKYDNKVKRAGSIFHPFGYRTVFLPLA